MRASRHAHSTATLWLTAIVGAFALLLVAPAPSHADEANPNNYSCLGSLTAGTPEAGSEDQQVKYSFYCNGPITGYQIQSQIPVTGVQSPPLITNAAGTVLPDTFACSGEIPGWALNCVGAAKAGYETISGQFAIGSKICVEPRVDALLTVTDAYLEKTTVTQAISGPFELGRPTSCPRDAFSGSTRLNPKPLTKTHKKAHKGHHSKHSTSKKK